MEIHIRSDFRPHPEEEGNQNGSTGQASWNKRTATDNWGTPGGQAGVDYESNEADSVTITADPVGQWLEWDLKSLVQDWVSDPASNFGALLKLENDHQSVYDLFKLRSSEYSDASKRPMLMVNYSTGVITTYYIRDATGNVIATYKK